jgi:hypothetical protein
MGDWSLERPLLFYKSINQERLRIRDLQQQRAFPEMIILSFVVNFILMYDPWYNVRGSINQA